MLERASLPRSRRGKPVAGYPSQSAAVRALHAEGFHPKEIGERLGTSVENVRARIAAAKTSGARKDERAGEDRGGRPTSTVELNYDVLRQLRPFARARGTNANQVAREIVEAVLELRLVDRVLAGRF